MFLRFLFTVSNASLIWQSCPRSCFIMSTKSIQNITVFWGKVIELKQEVIDVAAQCRSGYVTIVLDVDDRRNADMIETAHFMFLFIFSLVSFRNASILSTFSLLFDLYAWIVLLVWLDCVLLILSSTHNGIFLTVLFYLRNG